MTGEDTETRLGIDIAADPMNVILGAFLAKGAAKRFDALSGSGLGKKTLQGASDASEAIRTAKDTAGRFGKAVFGLFDSQVGGTF